MRRSFSTSRYRHTLLKGTPSPSAQTRAASVKTLSRSLWGRAKLPKPAIAACWRRSFSTLAESSAMREFPRYGGCGMQHLEAARKGRHCRAGGQQLGDDLQPTQKIGAAVGFGEASMAVDGGHNLRHVAGGIEHTKTTEAAQSGGDLGPELTIGEPQVDDGKVRLVTKAELDRLGDRTGNAAHLIAMRDQRFFGHVGNHEVVFGDQDLEHAPSSSSAPGDRSRRQ